MTKERTQNLHQLFTLLIILFSFHVQAQKWDKCFEKNLHSLETHSPDSTNLDLSFLASYIGENQIVSLGEPTHGSKEVFLMKHRMIKYLIKELDFTVFAIEANTIECDRLNDYIQTGKGDPKRLLSQLGYWVWDTQEVLDLINWMRDYNENHDKPVIFSGFDMQSYAYPLYLINQSIPQNSTKMNNALSLVNEVDIVIRNNQALGIYQVNDSLREIMYENSKTLYEELIEENTIQSSVSSSLMKQGDLLLQYATFNSKHKPEHGYRDSCMAENLNWITTQNSDAKMIVWAHNGHVKDAAFTMGRYMKALGMEPYVIGFSTYSGEYTAIANGEIVNNKLQQPNYSCYEYYFNIPQVPYYFIDLKTATQTCEFLKSPYKFREIGSMRREDQFFESELVKEYDAIVHIQKTTGSDCFYKKRK